MPSSERLSRFDAALQKDLIETAHALADAARIETLRYFRTADLPHDNKVLGGFDPVTVADRAAETAMRAVLAERRPNDGILGEEHGQVQGTSGLRWVLDPIDGTRGYISGTPTWGVLIALEDAQGPVMGVIDQPYVSERFFGGFGQADVLGPMGRHALNVRKTTELGQATILTTFPEVGSAQEGAAFHRVASKCKLTRYGMDCYGYALLAAGQVDLVIEAGLQAYDIAAPLAVVEAAGGIVTNWSGDPVHGGGRVIAAATPALHKAAMEILNDG